MVEIEPHLCGYDCSAEHEKTVFREALRQRVQLCVTQKVGAFVFFWLKGFVRTNLLLFFIYGNIPTSPV